MQPSDENTQFFTHNLLPSNPNHQYYYPPAHHFASSSTNNTTTSAFHHLTRFPNNHPALHQMAHQLQDFNNPPAACFISSSGASTSDEAEEQQLMNERRQRRMISNRESARRSRMRKQKHLDELWSQVNWLRNENQQLLGKLNHVAESHEQVVQENVHLKEEASELRQILTTGIPHIININDPTYPAAL
nr:basic leucine zipper 8 [Ipomoea trifida]